MQGKKNLIFILGLSFFVSCSSQPNRSIASNDKIETLAKRTAEDFIFRIANGSGAINIKSRWDKLSAELKDVATPSAIESVLNDKSEATFNESLIKIITISASAQTLARLNNPKVIGGTESDGASVFMIKPYDSELAGTYEVTCAEREVRGFFGGKSFKYLCLVTGVELMSSER